MQPARKPGTIQWRTRVKKISEYTGVMLNHLEAVYRPGDRQLAREFLTALGLHVQDFSYSEPDATQMLAIHFEPADKDSTNNIIFLHQMSPPQAAFDEQLRSALANNATLTDAKELFDETIRKYPGGTPHFGVRYRSMEELDQVVERLNSVSNDLEPRVTVTEMAPYAPREGMPNIRQVFVQTDVITTSPAGFGQTIELQVERP